MRKLVYIIVLALVCAGVYLKSRLIVEHQKKETLSIDSQWQKNGKPVVVAEARKKKINITQKVSGVSDNSGVIEAYVTPEVAGRLEQGQKFAFNSAVLADGSNDGYVLSVSQNVDLVTGLYKVNLLKSSPTAKKGIITAHVLTGVYSNVIAVPNDSVFFDEGVRYCWLVKNGLADKRRVLTGIATESDTIINSGLAVGDLVVIKGGYALEQGDKVYVCEQNSELCQ